MRQERGDYLQVGAPAHAGISAGCKQDQQAEILDEVRVVAKLRSPSDSLKRFREVLSQQRREVHHDSPKRAKGGVLLQGVVQQKGACGKRKRVPQEAPIQQCMHESKQLSSLPGSVRWQQYLARGDIPPQMGEPTVGASKVAVSSLASRSVADTNQEVVPTMAKLATRGRDDFLEQRFSSIATRLGLDSGASLDAVSNQAVVKQASHFGSSASNSSFVQTAGKVKRDMAASSSGGYKPMPKPFLASNKKKRPVFCYPTAASRQAKQARVGESIHAGYEQLPGEGGLSRSSASGEVGASLTTHKDAIFPPKLSRGPG